MGSTDGLITLTCLVSIAASSLQGLMDVARKPSLACRVNSMKLVISLHSLYWSIHTKDESKRGIAFAFIFGVN